MNKTSANNCEHDQAIKSLESYIEEIDHKDEFKERFKHICYECETIWYTEPKYDK